MSVKKNLHSPASHRVVDGFHEQMPLFTGSWKTTASLPFLRHSPRIGVGSFPQLCKSLGAVLLGQFGGDRHEADSLSTEPPLVSIGKLTQGWSAESSHQPSDGYGPQCLHPGTEEVNKMAPQHASRTHLWFSETRVFLKQLIQPWVQGPYLAVPFLFSTTVTNAFTLEGTQ